MLKDGAEATEAELIDWCRQQVGSVKKPRSVDFSDEPLPKSAVGKMLRRLVKEKYWEDEERGVHGA